MWLERQFGARVTWLPYDLHPDYPPSGIARAVLIERYGGSSIDWLRGMFAEEGLEYAPNPDVVPNTRLALELGEQARAEHVHDAYHQRVMAAYWASGADLSQRPVLEALARAAGVSDFGVASALDERVWATVVDDSTRRAQAIGVLGVPAFLINHRVLVIGAQPRAVLRDAFTQAQKLDCGDP